MVVHFQGKGGKKQVILISYFISSDSEFTPFAGAIDEQHNRGGGVFRAEQQQRRQHLRSVRVVRVVRPAGKCFRFRVGERVV